MAREFKLQDPGEGIHEAQVVEVRVAAGDEVEEGETLLIVETDKATNDLPSPYSGRVDDVAVSEGDVVEVGDVLVTFTGDGEAAAEQETEPQPADEETGEEEADTDGEAAAVGELPTSEDQAPQRRPQQRTAEEERAQPDGERPVPASPATRRLARELDVDLRRVTPSGPQGRVTAADVRAASEAAEAPEPEPEEERPARPSLLVGEAPQLPDFTRWGPVERQPLRGVRRTTAQRMATSWRQIPHVTHHDLADVTELERWRRQRAPAIEDAGGQLSLLVMVVKAVAGLLTRHPRLNASLDVDAEELVVKHHYHIGVAVDTDDGLLVPVVRDVDRKSVHDLAVEIPDLVARTRQREIEREQMQGGTFTITNVGPLGGTGFTPLIRHPEVAILGMARARLEPAVVGDLDDHRQEVRLRLPLSLSFDHRVNDGADGARFTGELVKALSGPDHLLLTV